MAEMSLADLARWARLPASQNIEDRRGLPSGRIDPMEARTQGGPFEMPLRQTPWDADIMRPSAPQFSGPQPDMNLRSLADMLQSRFGIAQNDPLSMLLK